jgi:anti-anti-sigma factor
MELVQGQIEQVPIIHVIGDVDHEAAPVLGKSIEAVLTPGSSCLLLGLESCPYLDSGGVSVVLDTLRRLRPRGWLGLLAPRPDVYRILSIVVITFDPHLRVFTGPEEARTALLSTETAS